LNGLYLIWLVLNRELLRFYYIPCKTINLQKSRKEKTAGPLGQAKLNSIHEAFDDECHRRYPRGVKMDRFEMIVSPAFSKMPSLEQVCNLLRFLPKFEKMKPDEFAQLIREPRSSDGEYVVGRLHYHRAVHDFEEACYENGFIHSFNWGAWTFKARQYFDDPAPVMDAGLLTCVKLVTAHIRAERFCDGHLQDAFNSGQLIAILRRLKQLSLRRARFSKPSLATTSNPHSQTLIN